MEIVRIGERMDQPLDIDMPNWPGEDLAIYLLKAVEEQMKDAEEVTYCTWCSAMIMDLLWVMANGPICRECKEAGADKDPWLDF